MIDTLAVLTGGRAHSRLLLWWCVAAAASSTGATTPASTSAASTSAASTAPPTPAATATPAPVRATHPLSTIGIASLCTERVPCDGVIARTAFEVSALRRERCGSPPPLINGTELPPNNRRHHPPTSTLPLSLCTQASPRAGSPHPSSSGRTALKLDGSWIVDEVDEVVRQLVDDAAADCTAPPLAAKAEAVEQLRQQSVLVQSVVRDLSIMAIRLVGVSFR